MISSIVDCASSLCLLTILELILGVDNAIVIALLVRPLEKKQKNLARKLGMIFALFARILFLFCAYQLMQLHHTLFSIFNIEISVGNIFLFFGSIFLLYKTIQEIIKDIHQNTETHQNGPRTLKMVVIQIMIMDLVFSVDSVMAAVGMTQNFFVMLTAMILALVITFYVARPFSVFVEQHVGVRFLAFGFLIMLSMVLFLESINYHTPRSYLYVAVLFGTLIEFFHAWKRRKNVHQHPS